ncbi:Flp family type IVb pilin [Arthrobacter sp. TWP1-1]|uniref:Flp family type IVb pilin n=1 Tax=Arthrobacter sp. TWP1-1 TaxID=2804568 RepID=UPI003CE6723A
MLLVYVISTALPVAWWVRLRLAESDDNERGATATEYAVLIGLIAVAIVGGVSAFGTGLGGYFTTTATTVGTLLNP